MGRRRQLDELGLAPAFVAGNSFGAAISLKLAGTRPELIRALTVHEPPLFSLLAASDAAGPALDDVQHRISAVIELLEAGEMEEGARQFVETIAFGPGAWAMMPPETQRVFVNNAPTWLDETRDPDALTLELGTLSAFGAPALVSTSDNSPPFFPAVVDVIAAALPNARRNTFSGGGHVPHLLTPEAYVATVTDFLSTA